MLIEIKNLNKRYQNHVALKDINLSISEGIVFGLLGPNGAGKTSLIRILTQITEADSGSIHFNGEPLKASHIKNMGYLPEERGLYKKMQVSDHLLYLAELKGLNAIEAKARLKYWVDKFEIKSWLGKKVEELSKGMQQKIQFVATVLHEPKLIILDEPFSGFDPVNAQILTEEILNLKKNGATIIFSTHRMDSVEQLCDKIALINKSEKILEGTVPELKDKYKKNLFEVKYTGVFQNLNSEIEVVSNKESNGYNSAILRAPQQFKPNQLISSLLNSQIEILSFAEQLPSMEEIFIEVVNQKK